MDRVGLENALLNLASNARDAIGERPDAEGAFELSTRRVEVGGGALERHGSEAATVPPLRPGAYVRLTARDDGCGIDPATLGRVLDPFFSTKSAGTGLGLATVARVARGAGGAVRIDSEPGEGTAIHLYLPVARPA